MTKVTKRNRKKTAITVAGLGALLLTTGTFAWTSISQQALNEKSGKIEAGGRVHDDYNKESGNKDIYAENYQTQNVIVRIKLSEYMEDNLTPMVAGTVKTDKSTWTPFTVPGSKNSEAYRNYVTWDLGGEKVFLPTFNKVETDKSVDASGDAIDVLTNGQTAPGTGEHIDFTAGTEYNATGAVVTTPGTGHVAKSTLTQSKAPLSMADWLALPAADQKGDFWVIDEDGWAYWANILAPGESTSLLLSQLNWDQTALGDLDDWYYGIDVLGEFATKSDVGKFATDSAYGAPSTNANQILDMLTVEPVSLTITASGVNADSNTIDAGTSRQFTATAATRATTEWSVEPASAGTIDNTGKLTINRNAVKGTKVTINAKQGRNTGSKELTVTSMNGAVVGDTIQFNGQDYIYLKDLQDGNRLIMSKATVGTAATSLTYNGSALDTLMKSHYASLSEAAKAEVQPVQASFDVGAPKGTTAIGRDADGFLVTSPTPDRAVVTEGGEKKAFALSVDELNDVSGPGKVFETVASREALNASGAVTYWWLRSPVTSTHAWYVSTGSNAGSLYASTMTTASGARPAYIINR